MNYIYDILTNFNDDLIDFFEWNKKDSIIRIKKIPILKISSYDFKNIFNHKIILNKELLEKLYLKTEFWNINKNDDLYYLLISDGNGVLVMKFNENGKDIKRSSLYIDEELEVLEICERLQVTEITYKKLNKINYKLKTRKELKEEVFLKNEIDKLEKVNNTEKIKYIYFECFGKKESNVKKAIKEIKSVLKNVYTPQYKNLFNFFKLTSINK